jgi:hypothetical protein
MTMKLLLEKPNSAPEVRDVERVRIEPDGLITSLLPGGTWAAEGHIADYSAVTIGSGPDLELLQKKGKA